MNKLLNCGLLLSLAVFASCNKNVQCVNIQSEPNNPVLAVINGESITKEQFEKGLEGPDKGALIKAKSEMYETKMELLRNYAFQQLVEAEAKKKNISVDEYFKKEVDGKVKAVSEKDINDFYDKVKKQFGQSGRPVPPLNDDVKGKIKEQLTAQKSSERMAALSDELFEKNKVTFALKQPRMEVGLGTYPVKGPKEAKITIVEFSDFECPYCKKGSETMKEVLKKYKGKVNYYFRDFPLSFHKRAKPMANAARCASDQGKFWPLHDKLFDNQSKSSDEDLIALGKELKLDMEKYEACVKGMTHIAAIEKDFVDGQNVGVSGTPAYFINGVFLSGAVPLKKFEEIIEKELKN